MSLGRVCFGAFLRCTAVDERVFGCCGMHGLCSDLSSPQADLCAQLSPFMFQTKPSSKTVRDSYRRSQSKSSLRRTEDWRRLLRAQRLLLDFLLRVALVGLRASL